MNVRELLMTLSELILLGKGDTEVGILCDGSFSTVDDVYTDGFDGVILGDCEAKESIDLENVKPQTVGTITIKDKENAYGIKLSFDYE